MKKGAKGDEQANTGLLDALIRNFVETKPDGGVHESYKEQYSYEQHA